MTARLSIQAKNAVLAGVDLATIAAWMSLHSGFPPAAGNQLSGRQPVTWDPPNVGCRTTAAAVDLDVAAGTVRAIALWEFGGGGLPVVWSPYASRPTRAFAVTAADLAGDLLRSEAHGLAVGDHVLLWATVGALLPENLAEDTEYHVVGVPDANSFQVSDTPGGPPANIVGEGDGDFQQFAPEPYAAAGVASVSSFTVCLPG